MAGNGRGGEGRGGDEFVSSTLIPVSFFYPSYKSNSTQVYKREIPTEVTIIMPKIKFIYLFIRVNISGVAVEVGSFLIPAMRLTGD